MTSPVSERRWASHVAYLNPLVGSGLLVLPGDDGDVLDPMPDAGAVAPLPGGGVGLVVSAPSIHAVELDAVLTELRSLSPSFEPTEPEDWRASEWCEVGRTEDGRLAVALIALDALVGLPTVEEEADAMRELCRAAGVVPPA